MRTKWLSASWAESSHQKLPLPDLGLGLLAPRTVKIDSVVQATQPVAFVMADVAERCRDQPQGPLAVLPT